MDPNTTPVAPTNTSASVQTPQPVSRRNVFLVFIGICIVLGIVSIILGKVFYGLFDRSSEQVVITEEKSEEDAEVKLPLYLSYLNDSSFSNWSAFVTGVVTSKDEGSFTITPTTEEFLPGGQTKVSLVKNAKPLIVAISSQGPAFYYSTPSANTSFTPPSTITFEDVAINSLISGNADISYINDNIVLLGKNFVISGEFKE